MCKSLCKFYNAETYICTNSKCHLIADFVSPDRECQACKLWEANTQEISDIDFEELKKQIKCLHEYCFCTQDTYKKMGYYFNQKMFDSINLAIDNLKAIYKRS